MANKNKGKVVQMLSPENYIRQRARSLPLYECTVNKDWEISKIALLTIARRHSNGNITDCMYMVDLFCKGVKDSHFHFNIPLNEYKENQAKQSEMMDFEPIDYNLAHNIVYSALAFAEDYEFKPHKVFTSTTRFMLEEDTDDVPLIDIKCGLNGKPAFLMGMLEDDKADQRIIAHLERVVGPGNFTIISDPDSMEDFEPENQDNLEEKEREFLELYNKEAKLNGDEYIHYSDLSNELFSKLTDDSEFDKHYDELRHLQDFNLKDTNVSNEMLGISMDNSIDYDDLRILFSEIFYLTFIDNNEIVKKWETYKEKAPDLPSTCFLELLILEMANKGNDFDEKLKEYFLRFPDYKLLKMLYFSNLLSTDDVDDAELVEMEQINFYYQSKKRYIHEIEFYFYMVLTINIYSSYNQPSRLDALHAIIDELGINENLRLFLQNLIILNKTYFVKEILDQKYGFNQSEEEPF